MRLEQTPFGYALKAEGISPDGQPCTDSCAIHLDGEEHADPSVQGVSTIAACPDPRVIDVQATMDGRVVGRARYAVSADGRTLTAETSGTDAQGRQFTTVITFERE